VRAVISAMTSFWSDGYAVVVDGVVGPWFLDTLRGARPRQMEVDYVILLPSLSATLERVAMRTGHRMKDTRATEHMHKEFDHTRQAVERHVIDTSTLTPAETVAVIVEQRARQAYRLEGLS
jgi:hypothetical protein